MRKYIGIIETYWEDDGYDEGDYEGETVPEPREYILRAGTTVYHGTNVPFREKDGLEGPVWVTDSEKTARYFATWKEGGGKARLTVWEVRSDYRLAVIDTEFLNALDEIENINLHYGPGDILRYLRFRGFEGWIIPDNYGTQQADICLSDPSGLTYLKTTRLTESASDIPPTNWGYWITHEGEILPVRSHQHDEVFREHMWSKEHDMKYYDMGSVSALGMGWIWVKATPHDFFIVDLMRGRPTPRALSSLSKLARSSDYFEYWLHFEGKGGKQEFVDVGQFLRAAIQGARDTTSLMEDLQRNPLADPSFRAWFGNSRVVDGEGRPLIVYHGTAGDVPSFRGMVWGSVHPELASTYAEMRDYYAGGGGNVIPLYMRIEHPLDADALPRGELTVRSFFASAVAQARAMGQTVDDQAVSELMHTTWNAGHREESGPYYAEQDFWYDTRSMFGRDGAEAIQRLYGLLGFDGIRYTESDTLTFGVFSDEQVRSAIR